MVSSLKKLPLGPAELAIVKEKAGLLHQGELRRGEAVLPIMLASFIFDVLRSSDTESKAKRQAARKLCETTKEDEELGFKAALYAIGTVNKGKLKVIELTPEVRKLLSIAGKNYLAIKQISFIFLPISFAWSSMQSCYSHSKEGCAIRSSIHCIPVLTNAKIVSLHIFPLDLFKRVNKQAPIVNGLQRLIHCDFYLKLC